MAGLLRPNQRYPFLCSGVIPVRLSFLFLSRAPPKGVDARWRSELLMSLHFGHLISIETKEPTRANNLLHLVHL